MKNIFHYFKGNIKKERSQEKYLANFLGFCWESFELQGCIYIGNRIYNRPEGGKGIYGKQLLHFQVVQLTNSIAEKKNDLAPVIKELRPLRQECQVC